MNHANATTIRAGHPERAGGFQTVTRPATVSFGGRGSQAAVPPAGRSGPVSAPPTSSPSPVVPTGSRPPNPGDVVESVVMQLNAICKAATLDFALNVGKLIVTRLYAGDL